MRTGAVRLYGGRSSTAAPSKLNIAVGGSSVQGDNGGITFSHQPIQQIIANLTAWKAAVGGRDFTVTNITAGNEDTLYWADPVRVAIFNSQFNASAGWLNIAVLMETADYIDDTLGFAGGGAGALSLTNPTAAGQLDYDAYKLWSDRLKAIHTSWLTVPVCPPDVNEPSDYADATANASYRTARNYSNSLKLANADGAFWRVIDAYSNANFHGTLTDTYYQNPGLGQRIHLVEAGGDLLGLIEFQAITAGLP